MDELLPAPVESETHATCADCAMCQPADAPAEPNVHYFNPAVKCCTFLPALPSFLVGRILLDPDPGLAPGRASVEARIAAGVAVTPLGLGRPAAQDAHESGSGFGRDEALLCPHYVREDGTCGIWPHREATCTTFFCKHDRGAVGAAFWDALRHLLAAVEQALAWHCVEALDVGAAAVARLLDAAGRPNRDAPPEERAALWGTWSGRERAFYQAAARLVDGMSWAEILVCGGPQVRLHAGRVGAAQARLYTTAMPPGPLHLRSLHVTAISRSTVRITTYSGDDPLIVPRALFDVLPRFDGSPAADALRVIEEEDGLQVEPDVVRRLLDFDVLAAPDGPPGPAAPA